MAKSVKKTAKKATKSTKPAADPVAVLEVPAPKFRMMRVRITGTAPLCLSKFSEKSKRAMMEKQAAGGTGRTTRKTQPRDFEADYEAARYRAPDGWDGIPAGAFRSAMISACRSAGVVMTRAKQAVFIEADGIDGASMTPLVKINGKPRRLDAALKNATGVADIRVRPIWDEWSIDLRIRYDADLITPQSVLNLLARAGLQVGVGEGRPDSSKSTGCGWGCFEVEERGARAA